MLELTVTTFGPRKIPTIVFKESDEVPDFHMDNNKLFGGSEEDA